MDATDNTQEAARAPEEGGPGGTSRRSTFVLGVLVGIGATLAVAVLLRPRPTPPKEPVLPADLLAEVGNRWILRGDFEREMRRRSGPHPEKLDKAALLEEMIQREAFLAKADKLGLTTDADVKRRRDNVVIGELRQRELEPRLQAVKVTDEQIEQYYNANTAAFTRPGKRRLACIFIKTHAKMTPEKFALCKTRAEKARELAQAQDVSANARGFGELAIQYSEDQATRYKGGDAGWFTEGRERYRWPSDVVTAGFALEEIGDLSRVIATPDGLYLLMLTDQRPPIVTPLDDAAARIRHGLLLDERKRVEHTFSKEALQAVDVRVRTELLESIPIPDSHDRKRPAPPPLPGHRQ